LDMAHGYPLNFDGAHSARLAIGYLIHESALPYLKTMELLK